MNELTLPKYLTLHEFDDRNALAEALANEIAHQLERSIQMHGRASLAVSGGSTPLLLFRALSQAELAWTEVSVTLVDERWVSPDDARSNERLVKENLLIGRAAFAHFVPLYLEGSSPQDAEERVGAAINAMPQPLDVVVLGIGTDGHTASFFPDSDALLAATDPFACTAVKAINAKSAKEPRMTMTLPMLTSSRFLALHIEGKEKRQTLEAAMQDGDANAMPVRHILRRKDVFTNIFWAP
jgi:6-phosphogluconolactonase